MKQENWTKRHNWFASFKRSLEVLKQSDYTLDRFKFKFPTEERAALTISGVNRFNRVCKIQIFFN